MQESSSSRIFLLAAVLLGVLATVLAFIYLQGQDASRVATRSVVVAAHDLPAGRAVDPEKDFAVWQVPATFSFSGTVDADSRMAFKGQRPDRTILAKQPVLLSDFAASADLELSPSKVGISVNAAGANGLSNLLIPGDMVKIYVTKPIARAGAPGGPMQWTSLPAIADPVRVLAVGSRLIRVRSQIGGDGGGESDARTVTLEVTEAQAKDILEQTGAGQLAVTLILIQPAMAPPPAAKNP